MPRATGENSSFANFCKLAAVDGAVSLISRVVDKTGVAEQEAERQAQKEVRDRTR